MSNEPEQDVDTARERVARVAADDVARLLDRRGLRDVVALAHRVLNESMRDPEGVEGLTPGEPPAPSRYAAPP